MGAWSTKPFGNDVALDWLFKLQNHCNADLYITEVINDVVGGNPQKKYICEEVIAAAAIVAAAAVEPVRGIHADAKAWILEKGYVPNIALIQLAIVALQQIICESELRK